MIQAGILREDDPVELLEGWIVCKMTRNPPHDVAVALAGAMLIRLLPHGWHVRQQSAITTDDSEPEPDVAVVRGDARRYRGRHPGPSDVVAVMEVADTSLTRDRIDKASIYGRAGVPVYWIVNLSEGKVEVYSDPTGPGPSAGYRARTDFTRGQSVPLRTGGQDLIVRVDDLLP
jgi:Uma2 family endonuclease